MTDDCTAERSVLGATFPEALLLLCIFHVLQAVWRWILASNHKIQKVDKPVLFQLFRDLMYAETQEELNDKYQTLQDHPVMENYSNV